MDFLLQHLAGDLGRGFVNLAFVAALLSTIAYFFSEFRTEDSQRAWRRMGLLSFWIHAVALTGTLFTLFSMIYFHWYQYHYVWSHSSNELPVYYMISCFWEGQEGSFLLWSFWHVILSVFILITAGKFKSGVMAVIMSVQALLTSMLLGVYLPISQAQWVLGIGVPLIGLGYFVIHRSVYLQAPIIILSVLTPALVLSQNLGIEFGGISIVSVGLGLFLLGLLILWIRELFRKNIELAGLLIWIFLWLIAVWLIIEPLGDWRIGSSPFLLLSEAMPNAPVFQQQPDFIPSNGKGLNPLLQNYWMVIHPPTLFLGFALTLIPFAYAFSSLLKGEVQGWIRPAMIWNLLSAAVLGTGILMGGYWAYETLSFGGYWNWDPVENSSLVPWLTNIAALHALVAWRHRKRMLPAALGLVLLTFLLVLYSTFLTRSGILGEASVHSFTDLGLSGQLLLLLGLYVILVSVVWVRRQSLIPKPATEMPTWSKEFFLFLATIILLFTAIEIIFFTSSPVINKIFNLRIAPKNALFYYQWNIWFSIAIALLSGIGQFFFWIKVEKETLLKAIYRPFALAAGTTLIIMFLLMLAEWDFVYNVKFREELSLIQASGNIWNYGIALVQYGVLFLGDEILLLCALFSLFANAEVGIRLFLRRGENLKFIGGTLAHAGFALMLLGILFSSGYDQIVSVNFQPNELGNQFPEDARIDNVLLMKGEPKYIKGYKVTYLGKKQAQSPLSHFRLIERETGSLKFRFKDATGDVFAVILPAELLPNANNLPLNSSMDSAFQPIQKFVEENLDLIKQNHINERSLYRIYFENLLDSADTFTLYPEAEINESMGILAHPSRKIQLEKDIYVHVSSIPDPEGQREEVQQFEIRLAKGDSARTGSSVIWLENLVQVKDVPEFEKYTFVAKAKLKIIHAGKTYSAEPLYIIDNRQPLSLASFVKEAGLALTFSGVEVEAGKIVIQVEELIPPPDWIVMKAIAKPYINLLWLGTFLLVIGFGVALRRRWTERNSE